MAKPLASGLLVVGEGDMEYFHASVAKNSSHRFAMEQMRASYPIVPSTATGGCAPVADCFLCNGDIDSVYGVGFCQLAVGS